MLELRTIRHLKADKKFLSFIGSNNLPTIKTTDGSILEIKKTNIKTIKPIIYDNLNNKRYYIPNYKKSYTLNQIKEIIRNMLTTKSSNKKSWQKKKIVYNK